MFRPRVMPCLLLRNRGLVKTVRFRDASYVGDPINAVHIFNAKEADELIFLDIDATREERTPPLDLVEQIADQCFMPFAVGGGVASLATIRELLSLGVEKVVLNTRAIEEPEFVQRASDQFGSSTIVVCVDAAKKRLGGYTTMTRGGSRNTQQSPWDCAETMQRMGAGEIVIQSIDRDGSMAGYDVDLVSRVSRAVDVPVVACGGAGSLADFAEALTDGDASAVAAGSFFVYHGKRRAVLISFPSREEQQLLYVDS